MQSRAICVCVSAPSSSSQHMALILFAFSFSCFVNTPLAVSRGSGAKQSEQRDAAQPLGKHFSKTFLMFSKLLFLTDFCMAADRHVTAPS